MMEVILLQRVEALGQMGDVVKVRPGFARNYLLPQKVALRATKDNLAYFGRQRSQLEAQNLDQRKDAEAVAAKLDGLRIVLIRQAGETGQLYGSVTPRDIAEAITAAGFSVNRRQVLLEQPIKACGLFKTRVALHPEVTATVITNIAQSETEAAAAAAAGAAPVATAEATPEGEATSAAAPETAAVPAAKPDKPAKKAAKAEKAEKAEKPAKGKRKKAAEE